MNKKTLEHQIATKIYRHIEDMYDCDISNCDMDTIINEIAELIHEKLDEYVIVQSLEILD